MGVPQEERAIAVHLCPQKAATWWGCPRLLSRACKFSLSLVDKLRPPCTPWPSLRVYQAKALKELHEGGPNQEVLQELCLATDYALWVTKVTAQALGRAMSTLVVQECHL